MQNISKMRACQTLLFVVVVLQFFDPKLRTSWRTRSWLRTIMRRVLFAMAFGVLIASAVGLWGPRGRTDRSGVITALCWLTVGQLVQEKPTKQQLPPMYPALGKFLGMLTNRAFWSGLTPPSLAPMAAVAAVYAQLLRVFKTHGTGKIMTTKRLLVPSIGRHAMTSRLTGPSAKNTSRHVLA